MFDISHYYAELNEQTAPAYQAALAKLSATSRATEGHEGHYDPFLQHSAQFLLNIAEFAEKIQGGGHFTDQSLDILLAENNAFYHELKDPHYLKSYANPEYCAQLFGLQEGQVLSYFYSGLRQNLSHAFHHRLFLLVAQMENFLEVYDLLKNKSRTTDLEELKLRATALERDEYDLLQTNCDFKERFDKDFRFYNDIILNSNLADPRYLFKTGAYITRDQIKTAEFIHDYPQEKISRMAQTIFQAYADGFKRDGKELGGAGRRTITLAFSLGLERIYRELIRLVETKGFSCLARGSLANIVNRQYNYDHQFDSALYLTDTYTRGRQENYQKALRQNRDRLADYSGIIACLDFGEPPFSPQNKKSNLKLSGEQLKLQRDHTNVLTGLYYEQVPRSATSFCMIAFPSPQIGERFPDIFHDIFEVNSLSSAAYETIQQKLIDALDQGDYVRVVGQGGNKTDIRVKMQTLKDPARHTNFENCGANVNIPIGEVFTSPRLDGTTGKLHVKQCYLRGMRFDDIELDFKDGFTTTYSCSNFAIAEENRNYVRENLLFPHESLPLGEFAIGTNTIAFVVSQKYGILSRLPILIIEKMGPHFAVGDTCYNHMEDQPIINPHNNKEMTAKDNELSVLRTEDPSRAYTNKHTDITIPYEELFLISVVLHDGRQIDIIKNGRFVLAGTETLNEPLDRYYQTPAG